MSDPLPGSIPQFATAEYSSSDKEVCKSCNQSLSGSYYRINGSLACANCATQLKSQLPVDTHSAFVRGILFGIGGAILGMVLYSAFGIITGLVIGYLSLAVGWLVGKAIRFGSGGIGGRRYQIAAVALTYFAVSMSAIPMGIYQAVKESRERKSHLVTSPPSASLPSTSVVPNNPPPQSQASANKPSMGIATALVGLLFLGLASPILELQNPLSGAIGIIILLVGIRIAWRLTAAPQIEILGPFTASSHSSPVPASS
jgi:hypothetical protein